jgi:hypothetical protein
MKYAAALFALVAFAPIAAAPAATPAGCYLPGEIEADQAMHFQTELMVLSDTCGGAFYRDFTVHNREQIMSYQHRLLDRFRRTGVKSPQASLDSFMTQVANEHALKDGAELRADVCSHAATLIAEATKIDRDDFRHRAAALAREKQAEYRRCK